MKRFAIGAVLLVALCGAVASAAIVRSWAVTTTAASPFTGSVPVAACDYKEGGNSTAGLNLLDCRAYYVCVSIGGANTLSGAGTLEAYFYEAQFVGTAHIRAGDADETLTSKASGQKEFCFPQRSLAPGTVGCAYFNPVGVTTSGGTQLTVTARCLK